MILIPKHRIQSYPKKYAISFCMAVALRKFRSPIFELMAAGHEFEKDRAALVSDRARRAEARPKKRPREAKLRARDLWK